MLQEQGWLDGPVVRRDGVVRIGILTPRSTGSDGEVCRVAVAQERELQRLGHEVVMGEDSLRSRACEILHVFHGGDELPSIPAPEEGAPPTVLFAHGEVDSGLRSIIDRLDRVVVPSRLHLVRLADELEFKPLQVRLLEPGLDLELPSQHRRPRPWSGSGPLQLLVLGGREDREGLISLARAVATLPAGSVRLTVPGPRDLLFDELLEGLVGEESFHAWLGKGKAPETLPTKFITTHASAALRPALPPTQLRVGYPESQEPQPTVVPAAYTILSPAAYVGAVLLRPVGCRRRARSSGSCTSTGRSTSTSSAWPRARTTTRRSAWPTTCSRTWAAWRSS